MKENVVKDKSKAFAIRVVRLYRHLCEDKKEYVLSKQVLRCGTSIGANIHEAIYGQSDKDFASKMSIALKEASETEYWLELLAETDYITPEEYKSIATDCSEINRLLISIVKSAKENLLKNKE